MVRPEVAALAKSLTTAHAKIQAWTPEEYAMVRDAMNSFIATKKVLSTIAWAPGDRVTFTGKRGQMVRGTVSKVNRVSLQVQEDGSPIPNWKVSPSLCTRLEH